jgi:small subunit ribosomal protein S6
LRNYELMVIVNPELEEEALNASIAKLAGWITANQGEVVKTDIWGRRRLAYSIKGQRDGQYVVFRYNMDPKGSVPLERNLKLAEEIVRYMVVNLDE